MRNDKLSFSRAVNLMWYTVALGLIDTLLPSALLGSFFGEGQKHSSSLVHAQQTPAPISAVEYPLFPISNMSLSAGRGLRFSKEHNCMYVVGAQGHCLARIDNFDSQFLFGDVKLYGPTTPVVNNCVASVMNSNESLLFVADNKNGGLNIIAADSLTLVSQLPGFSPLDIALSQDDQTVYLVDKVSGKGRVLVIDVSDPVAPKLLNTVTIDFSNAAYGSSNLAPISQIDLKIKQENGKIYVAISGYSFGAERTFYDAEMQIFSPNEWSSLRKVVFSKLNLAKGLTPVIADMHVDLSSDRVFLAIGDVLKGLRSAMANQLMPGGVTVDISGNNTKLSVLNSYESPSANTLTMLEDKKTVVIGHDKGLDFLNTYSLFPTDPLVRKQRWSLPSPVRALVQRKQFLYALTGNMLQAYYLEPFLSVAHNGFSAVPIFTGDENNAGKLFLFTVNPASSNEPVLAQPVITAITTPNGDSLPIWFFYDINTGLFSAVPSKDEMLQVRLNIGSQFCDVTLKLKKVLEVSLTKTPVVKTLEPPTPNPPTPQPSTLQPSTLVPTTENPATPVPSTMQPVTTSVPIVMTAAPVITPAPATFVPKATNPPATIVPKLDNLSLDTSGSSITVHTTEQKLLIAQIILPSDQVGQFMLNQDNLGSAIIQFDNSFSQPVLTIKGAAAAINEALAHLRFSADVATDHVELQVRARFNDENQWIEEQGALFNKFGVNHAPEPKIGVPANSGQIIQHDVELGETFEFSLGEITDSDGDQVNVAVFKDGLRLPAYIGNVYEKSPRQFYFRGLIEDPGTYTIAFELSDGYKKSIKKLPELQLKAEYKPITVSDHAFASVTVSAGKSKAIKLDLSVFSGGRKGKVVFAARLSDRPLPDSIVFEQTSAAGATLYVTAKSVGDIAVVITASDGPNRVESVFTVHAVNNRPSIVGDSSIEIIRTAGEFVRFPFMSHFNDTDGTALSFSGRQIISNGSAPLPSWMQLDEKTGVMTGVPPEEVANQMINLQVVATDPVGESATLSVDFKAEPSSLQLLKEILTWIITIGSGLFSFYELIKERELIAGMLRYRFVLNKDAFKNSSEHQAPCLFPTVKVYQPAAEGEKSPEIRKCGRCLSQIFSNYLQLIFVTHTEVKNPAWITVRGDKISVDWSKITADDSKQFVLLVVQWGWFLKERLVLTGDESWMCDYALERGDYVPPPPLQPLAQPLLGSVPKVISDSSPVSSNPISNSSYLSDSSSKEKPPARKKKKDVKFQVDILIGQSLWGSRAGGSSEVYEYKPQNNPLV